MGTPASIFTEKINLWNKQIKLICYENGGEKLADIDFAAADTAAVMIGSEGGFERAEVEKAVENGAKQIWLGERILSCEICPIAVTAIIMNLRGNMWYRFNAPL